MDNAVQAATLLGQDLGCNLIPDPDDVRLLLHIAEKDRRAGEKLMGSLLSLGRAYDMDHLRPFVDQGPGNRTGHRFFIGESKDDKPLAFQV